MSPDEINAAANAMVTATQNAAIASGQDINADAGLLAPGLAIGSSAPGGYNYQRSVAPVVPALTAQLVVGAKQGIVRDAVRNAVYSAQTGFDAAKTGYQARQRKFQQKQAQKSRDRQAEQDRRYNASLSSSGGGGTGDATRGGGYTVGGVDVQGSGGGPRMVPKNGKDGSAGYNFTDASGKPISAATFSKLVNVNFNDLLTQMAKSGDAGAARVMTQSDLSPQYANYYRALTWR